MVNHAHVSLSWAAASSATGYRVYRSTDPDTGFLLLDETPELAYEDLNQGVNANSCYYRVRGVNDCGVEGP